MRPPRAAEALMCALINDADTRDAVLGDFAEAWHDDLARGTPAIATLRYWRQTVWSLPSLFTLAWRDAGAARMLVAISIAVVVRVLMIVLQTGVIVLVSVLTSSRPTTLSATAAVLGCLCIAAVGGALARHLGGRAPAATVGVLCVLCLFLNATTLVTARAMPLQAWLLGVYLASVAAALSGAAWAAEREPAQSPYHTPPA